MVNDERKVIAKNNRRMKKERISKHLAYLHTFSDNFHAA